MAVTAISKIIIKGDEIAARKFIGPARSQMDILANQMSFQNLKQGVREISPYPGVIIRCVINHNINQITITHSDTTIDTPILIIYFDDDKVLVWDIENDQLLSIPGNDGSSVSGLVDVSQVSNYLDSKTPQGTDLFTITENLRELDEVRRQYFLSIYTASNYDLLDHNEELDFPDYIGNSTSEYDVDYYCLDDPSPTKVDVKSTGQWVVLSGADSIQYKIFVEQESSAEVPIYLEDDPYNFYNTTGGSKKLSYERFTEKSIGTSLSYNYQSGRALAFGDGTGTSLLNSNTKTEYESYSWEIKSPFTNGYSHDFSFYSRWYENIYRDSTPITADKYDHRKIITKYVMDVFSKVTDTTMVVINPVEVKYKTFYNDSPIDPGYSVGDLDSDKWSVFNNEDYVISEELSLIPKKVSALIKTGIEDVTLENPFELPYSDALETVLNAISEDITSIEIA